MNFLDRFLKNIQISNFIKIRPMGIELFHAGGRTNTTKLRAALRNFANAPKKTYVVQDSLMHKPTRGQRKPGCVN